MNVEHSLKARYVCRSEQAGIFDKGINFPAPRVIKALLSNWGRYLHNHRFIRRELSSQAGFFDTVESYPLDDQQRAAVVADEDNCLVVAGAGSGKSSTIVAKIRYLVNVQGVQPDEILVISFTNKSAADLRARINIDGVRPQTFHKFGLSVITEVLGHRPLLYGQQVGDPHLKDMLERLSADPRYASILHRFLAHHWHATTVQEGISREASQPVVKAETVDEFVSFSSSFITLMKANGLTVTALQGSVEGKSHDEAFRNRAAAFLEVFEPFFNAYQSHLLNLGQIDFTDMIRRAIGLLTNGEYKQRFGYIIIDEFQDISRDRYELIQAVRASSPGVKLFCVGDDWQSIYKFAGSELALFEKFRDHFGYTIIRKIETTYRFSQPLIGLSSAFILENTSQLSKKLRSVFTRSRTTFNILEHSAEDGDDSPAVIRALRNLELLGLSPDKTVMLIGRYNFDFKKIRNRTELLTDSEKDDQLLYTIKEGGYRGRQIKIDFLTAHKSKGLEADFVILINCNSGKFGWPSERGSDPLLRLVRQSASDSDNSEERRLFYVAMTRAKRHVTFVTDPDHTSTFIKEMKSQLAGKRMMCPRCGTGRIVRRMQQSVITTSCSYYPADCAYIS